MIADACVIIPVYNEAPVVRRVVDEVCRHFANVICVTDGSQDGSPSEVAKTRAQLLKHVINIGQGGALETGLSYAKRFYPKADYFVTFDSDGQHRVADAVNMVDKLRSGKFDIILGSRFLEAKSNLKPSKLLLLKAGTAFSNRMSGVPLTDTHNGLRAFNRKFAEALTITHSGMAHASEIIDNISRSGARFAEYPVTIDYTEYSLSKGQSMFNSVNIVFDLVLERMSKKK